VGAGLFALAQEVDGRLDAPDGREAEIEVQGGGLGPLLQTREPVSNSPDNININIWKMTYRRHKDQGLLEITQTNDLLAVDPSGAVLYDGVEVLQRRLGEEGPQNMLVDAVAGAGAEAGEVLQGGRMGGSGAGNG